MSSVQPGSNGFFAYAQNDKCQPLLTDDYCPLPAASGDKLGGLGRRQAAGLDGHATGACAVSTNELETAFGEVNDVCRAARTAILAHCDEAAGRAADPHDGAAAPIAKVGRADGDDGRVVGRVEARATTQGLAVVLRAIVRGITTGWWRLRDELRRDRRIITFVGSAGRSGEHRYGAEQTRGMSLC